MLYTPHFLTGAVIVKFIPNPFISYPLALLSHILLDLTPHNDFDIKPGVTFKEFMRSDFKNRNLIITALITDYFLCAIALLWIMFKFKNIWMLGGGLVAVLPDAVEQGLMVLGIALPGWQDKLQFRVPAKYGFIGYPVVSIIAIYLLLK